MINFLEAQKDSTCNFKSMYPVQPQDSPQEMERKRQVRPFTQLLLSFSPFPLEHSVIVPGIVFSVLSGVVKIGHRK